MKDEIFYIGYLPKMPKGAAKVIKIFVVSAFAAAIGLAVVSWIGQKPFAKSVFEFGTVKDFEGTIEARPVPFLLVEKPEKNNGLPTFERFPLVSEGKHGFDAGIFDGQRVKIKGTLIYRDDLRMIEVASDSIEKSSGSSISSEEQPETLGDFTLKGEIVDSKCYLGVMNPGQSKPHRDCAVACLRGGIPPLFIVKDNAGNVSELWLLSDQGASINNEILDFVAEPVEVSGEISRTGDQLFFKIDPKQIKRLP
ncbi:MAG TPA: hypothetical protein VNB22_08625 [Pyrinomonadaceae bacterium]|nr:hypothetical protein [Pyrinomonadaceae bacterium]